MKVSPVVGAERLDVCIFVFFLVFYLFSPFLLFKKPFILYYIIDLKLLYLRFKNRITIINGEGQDIMILITCPLIKLHFYLG